MKKNTKRIILGVIIALTLIVGGATVMGIDPPTSGSIFQSIQK